MDHGMATQGNGKCPQIHHIRSCVTTCVHASGKAFSKSGEETAEGSDFADTSSDTSNSPSPAAAASSQGVARQCTLVSELLTKQEDR